LWGIKTGMGLKKIYDEAGNQVGQIDDGKSVSSGGAGGGLLLIIGLMLLAGFLIGPIYWIYITSKHNWRKYNYYFALITSLLIIVGTVLPEDEGGMGGRPLLIVITACITNTIAFFMALFAIIGTKTSRIHKNKKVEQRIHSKETAPSQFTEMEVAINACQKSSKELEALIKEYKGDDPNKKLPWED